MVGHCHAVNHSLKGVTFMQDWPNRHKSTKPDRFSRRTSVRRRRRRRQKRLLIILIILCVVVFIISAGCLIHSVAQTYELRKMQAMHMEIIDDSASVFPLSSDGQVPLLNATEHHPVMETMASPPPTPVPKKPQIQEKFLKLYEGNQDLIGWLKVDCLYRINFAVVQGSNSFYMNHDFDKKENVNGSAFLDETCKIWPRDDNLIIYAHNMKSGDMFGELNQMQSISKLKDNPLVHFDSLYEKGTYIPIAVYVCSVIQAPDYFQFYVRNFSSESALERYVTRARDLSSIQLSTDVQLGDRLLTLVTCYDKENTKRLVVLLRQLRENENENLVQDILFAETSANRLYIEGE